MTRSDDRQTALPPFTAQYGEGIPVVVKLGDLDPYIEAFLEDAQGKQLGCRAPMLWRDEDAPLYSVFREPYFEWRLPADTPVGDYRVTFTIRYSAKGRARMDKHTFALSVLPSEQTIR